MSLSHRVLPSLHICTQSALTTHRPFPPAHQSSPWISNTALRSSQGVKEDQSPASQLLMARADIIKTCLMPHFQHGDNPSVLRNWESSLPAVYCHLNSNQKSQLERLFPAIFLVLIPCISECISNHKPQTIKTQVATSTAWAVLQWKLPPQTAFRA